MKWYERPGVLDYIIEAYAGVEGRGSHSERQFIWEEESGDIVLGNTRAFGDHLAERFGLRWTARSWTKIHELMRMLGELARDPYAHPKKYVGQKSKNTPPKKRVLRRRGRGAAE